MAEPEKIRQDGQGLPAGAEKSADPVEPAAQNDDIEVGKILRHADKNDADEALKVIQGVEGETIVLTPEEEKRLLRKIDWNMMPLLCLVYGLNYLDKTTVSYASIMGLKVRTSFGYFIVVSLLLDCALTCVLQTRRISIWSGR